MKHSGEPKGYKLGDWKMDSDYSGLTFLRSEMRKTWDGYWVHKDEWEPKHPQLSLKGVKDKQAVKPVRPRSEILIGTNLLLQSETFDNASWTKTNCTITANDTAAPDGQTTADALVDDGVSGAHGVEQNIATLSPQSALMASVQAKAGTQNYLLMKIHEEADTSNRVDAWFNLSDGSVSSTATAGTGSGVSARISRHSARGVVWYRCSLFGTPSTSGTGSTVLIQATDDDGNTLYTGTSETAIHIWGAYAHAGVNQGNYVVTTTSTVDISSSL